MQRNVRLAAYHPTVVSRWNVENIAGVHLNHTPIVHGCRGTTRNDHSNMLHLASVCAQSLANMLRPLPAGFIGGASDGHATNLDDLELALLEDPGFIRIFESLQDHVHHRRSSSA